jgi:hypothetical protein
MRKKKEPNTPWDLAQQHTLIRCSPCKGDAPYVLELGVNYFVLKLESLGAKTHWSCEGHPSGFYMVFSAPFALATKIAYASSNGADISIKRSIKKWVKGSNEVTYYKHPDWRMGLYPHGDNYESRDFVLRNLSVSWENNL